MSFEPRELQSKLSWEDEFKKPLKSVLDFYFDDIKIGNSEQFRRHKENISWFIFNPFGLIRNPELETYNPDLLKRLEKTGFATLFHLISTHDISLKVRLRVRNQVRYGEKKTGITPERLGMYAKLDINRKDIIYLKDMYLKPKNYLEKKGYDVKEFNLF